jgi:phosphate transport system substrate-binding protein
MLHLAAMRAVLKSTLLISGVLLLGLLACTDPDTSKAPTDTLSSGTIAISADETYRPVIEEQKKVFDSSYPDAHITIHYKPEAECFEDLLNRNARIILVTRPLTAPEKQDFLDRKIATSSLDLARDGVALVTSRESTDSVFVRPQLKGILSGTYKDKITVVFDHAGSSTVRFMQDSILQGAKLGANVFAAGSADSVIAYVKKNPAAIGFVGMPYIYQGGDDFRDDIRVGAIKNDSTGEFLKPYQAYVALRTYPLTRTLYYISGESYRGLGTGFANFMATERGQLIFRSSGLFPVRMNVIIRDANVNSAPNL